MNKEQLEQLSDLEINQAVTATAYNLQGWGLSESGLCFYHCGLDGSDWVDFQIIDYCNNPSDMMPLVFEGKVTLSPIQPYTEEHDPSLWCASCEVDSGAIECWHKNPLRAAAIAYLLMKEGG